MRDLKYVLNHTFNETAKALKKNGILFIIVCGVITFLRSMAAMLFSFGMGNIINYFVQIIFLSILAKVMNNIVTANRVPTSDFKYYLENYFINIMNTYFVIYVFNMFYSLLGTYFLNMPIGLSREIRMLIYVVLLYIIEEIILGSLFETVYIDGIGGLNAYRRAISFIKENFVPWIVVSSPYLILKLAETGVFTNYYMLPLWARILISIMTPILLLFRGKAYLLLTQSTKRKRKFMMEYDQNA